MKHVLDMGAQAHKQYNVLGRLIESALSNWVNHMHPDSTALTDIETDLESALKAVRELINNQTGDMT